MAIDTIGAKMVPVLALVSRGGPRRGIRINMENLVKTTANLDIPLTAAARAAQTISKKKSHPKFHAGGPRQVSGEEECLRLL